jgi:hypothetical protein
MDLNQLPVMAGSVASTIFVGSYLPMLTRAIRTRDLSSYSRSSLVLANAGNLVQTIYVVSLPVGPIWGLHGFYLVTTLMMLVLHVRHAASGTLTGRAVPKRLSSCSSQGSREQEVEDDLGEHLGVGLVRHVLVPDQGHHTGVGEDFGHRANGVLKEGRAVPAPDQQRRRRDRGGLGLVHDEGHAHLAGKSGGAVHAGLPAWVAPQGGDLSRGHVQDLAHHHVHHLVVAAGVHSLLHTGHQLGRLGGLDDRRLVQHQPPYVRGATRSSQGQVPTERVAEDVDGAAALLGESVDDGDHVFDLAVR